MNRVTYRTPQNQSKQINVWIGGFASKGKRVHDGCVFDSRGRQVGVITNTRKV